MVSGFRTVAFGPFSCNNASVTITLFPGHPTISGTLALSNCALMGGLRVTAVIGLPPGALKTTTPAPFWPPSVPIVPGTSTTTGSVFSYQLGSLSTFAITGSVITSTPPPTTQFSRPIPMGVSISSTPTSPSLVAGTAGMLVRSLSNPDSKFILSNNHVLGAVGPSLCPGSAPAATQALQPGTLDIGSDPGPDPSYVVGALGAAVPISMSPAASNLVDAAVAFTTPALASSDILGIGKPKAALGFPAPGMTVVKSGRSTGVTGGTVQAVNVTALVDYGSCGVARFVQQATFTQVFPLQAGDAGSVLLDSTNFTPVGLNFAASPTVDLANPIVFVYLSLGVFVDGAPTTISQDGLIREFQQKVAANPELGRLAQIQSRAEAEMFRLPGGVGMGIGTTEEGRASESESATNIDYISVRGRGIKFSTAFRRRPRGRRP